MGICLMLFVAGVILTTVGDDTLSATRVNLDSVVEQIRAGNVAEINQRSGVEILLTLKDHQRLLYFRPANLTLSDVLQNAAIPSDQLAAINFTTGDFPTAYQAIGSGLRLIGLAGVALTTLIIYLYRRQQVQSSG